MIYDDQPQMLEAVRLAGDPALIYTRERMATAFAAIDREALIEKAARAMVSFPRVGITKRWLAEEALVAAGIIAPAPSDGQQPASAAGIAPDGPSA